MVLDMVLGRICDSPKKPHPYNYCYQVTKINFPQNALHCLFRFRSAMFGRTRREATNCNFYQSEQIW